MTRARYDAIADFYTTRWSDDCDDPATAALLDLIGPVEGLDVLDLACGHGRVTRELARRGARAVGVDISARLLEVAQAAEQDEPLDISYHQADLTAGRVLDGRQFDLVTCNFALSDIDDLDAALTTTASAMRADARFVFSILHPCFPGSGEVSGSWPSGFGYRDEGWWLADGADSALRRQVGANHRMLSTYVNALIRHGLRIDEVVEPAAPPDWTTGSRADAARYPVHLAAATTKV